jgi:membrane-associated phospholipid phosphatase
MVWQVTPPLGKSRRISNDADASHSYLGRLRYAGAARRSGELTHVEGGTMTVLRPYLWAFLICVVLVVLAETFVDRPAARFAHDMIARNIVLVTMQRIPEWLNACAIPVLVVLGLWRLGRGDLPRPAQVVFLAAISLLLASAIKDQLKYAFGHTWPDTWINNNPSYIKDGVYGFFPFHGGPGYASFPSGHMTVVTSVMGVFWLAWPRLRAVWVLPPLITAIGLYGMDYHFVGDMIAGSFLGSAVAAATVRIAAAAAPGSQPLYASFSPGSGQSIATSSPRSESVR